MKYTFFTPGPSQLYPTVPGHIENALLQNILSISHRSEMFKTIFQEVVEGLQNLLHIPKEYHIVFVASGTEAMERIVENTVEKNSCHFVNGSFSKRWYETAIELNKDAYQVEAVFGRGFHTIPNIPNNTELICFTQNETSSGVAIHPGFIYRVAKKNPQALIAVDTVSSAPYVDINYRKLDIVFFSVQKLFGLPAGLGVIILSPRAIEKARYIQSKGLSIGTYHSFPTLVEWAEKYQTVETPNVLGIYLLGQVIKDMLKKGIKNIRKEIEENADSIYEFLEHHATYQPFVAEEDRSKTVIVAEVGDAKPVLAKVKEKGFIVGNGYGPLKKQQIRIANFPAIKKEDIERLLHVL